MAASTSGQEARPGAGEEAAVYPTFVPRNKGVVDGVWNMTDEAIVKQALNDALKRREAKEEGEAVP